jgi:membrane dipeptidase
VNAWVDHREDPATWARDLGVSEDAVALYLASDVIDLHVDSFIWHRLFGRSPLERQPSLPFLPGALLGHADLPRLREAQIGGATWVITTNPLREGSDRARTFVANVRELERLLESEPDQVKLVTTAAEYRAARATGRHAAFLGVQGGNAFDHDFSALAALAPGRILRVTLMHLTRSELGVASAPLGSVLADGLGRRGMELVEHLNELRIFVDLAHASPRTFWQALEVHDRSLPAIVTHTGVSGVHRHWRNLDDSQLRAVAETGGVVGIIYHSPYLGDPVWGGRVETIVRHLEHVRDKLGDDFPALGSDWDGFIVTPRDMPTCLELPRLVDCMLRRRWREEAIQKALGLNFLRALRELRG